jgi:hypothetical protein
MSALSTPTYNSWKKEIEEEKNKELTKMTKSKEKPKQGHLKWANLQNLVPKDMGNGSTQPSKTHN